MHHSAQGSGGVGAEEARVKDPKPAAPRLADEIALAKKALSDNRTAVAEFSRATKELCEAVKRKRARTRPR